MWGLREISCSMDFNINHREAKAAALPRNWAACHSHSHSLTVLFLPCVWWLSYCLSLHFRHIAQYFIFQTYFLGIFSQKYARIFLNHFFSGLHQNTSVFFSHTNTFACLWSPVQNNCLYYSQTVFMHPSMQLTAIVLFKPKTYRVSKLTNEANVCRLNVIRSTVPQLIKAVGVVKASCIWAH